MSLLHLPQKSNIVIYHDIPKMAILILGVTFSNPSFWRSMLVFGGVIPSKLMKIDAFSIDQKSHFRSNQSNSPNHGTKYEHDNMPNLKIVHQILVSSILSN